MSTDSNFYVTCYYILLNFICVTVKYCQQHILKIKNFGQARWLRLVIPELWGPSWADHLRLGVRDQPDQHKETPSLLKKKQN